MNLTAAAMARDALTGVVEALAVVRDGLPLVQSADLGRLASEASAIAAAARGLTLATLAEAESRGVVTESGSTTAAEWLRDQGAAVSEPEAHQARRAVALTAPRALQELRTDLLSGAVSPQDATAAARTFEQLRTCTDPAMHDEVAHAVAEIARTGLSRRILTRFSTEMLARYGTLDDEQRLRDHAEARRGVTGFRRTEDGLWHFEGWLAAPDKAVVDAALTALMAPTPDPETGEPDRRFPQQRRADALVTLARIAAVSSTTGPMGATCRTTLVITADALREPCEHRAKDSFGLFRAAEPCDCPRPTAAVDDLGTPLLPPETRELTCGSGVTPVVVDTHGRPLGVGRTERLATAAQRRALEVRDGGCSFPGCGAPASWTQAHHIRHWADGGVTDLDNLALLCTRHHRFVHQHGVTGHVTSDGSRVRWDVVHTLGAWRPRPPDLALAS